MDNSQGRTAQLGCGTLIIIAIIVAIFSNAGIDRKLDERVKQLEVRLEAIDAKLDAIARAMGVELPSAAEGSRPAPESPDGGPTDGTEPPPQGGPER